MICLYLWATHPGSPIPGVLCKHYPREIHGFQFQAYRNAVCRMPEFILGSMVAHAITALNVESTGQATSGSPADSSEQSLGITSRDCVLACVVDALAILSVGVAYAS